MRHKLSETKNDLKVYDPKRITQDQSPELNSGTLLCDYRTH